MPIAKGNDLITYTGTLGLLASFKKMIKNRPYPGKLYDMDALLATSTEAFYQVFKENTFFKNYTKIDELPSIRNILPNVRSVLEILEGDETICT